MEMFVAYTSVWLARMTYQCSLACRPMHYHSWQWNTTMFCV